VEKPEPHRLLAHRVAFDLDVGAVPIVIENLALGVHQALPSAVARAVQTGGGLVAQRGTGTLARPAVRQIFHDAQLLARPQPADHGRACEIVARVVGDLDAARNLDLVVHRRGHHQRTGARPVHQQCAALGALVVDGLQRRLEDGRDPRIARRLGLVLVGDQFGLHCDTDELIYRLDHVLDGGNAALCQRHQPGRGHLHLLADR
jgi:hypothetical protein